jgi:hypothetical protein
LYSKSVLARCLKVFSEKRPTMLYQEWFLHWDKSPVDTAATVAEFLAAKGVKMIPPPILFA